jgi:hypothetical protein
MTTTTTTTTTKTKTETTTVTKTKAIHTGEVNVFISLMTISIYHDP